MERRNFIKNTSLTSGGIAFGNAVFGRKKN